jgi:hypothetical protein
VWGCFDTLEEAKSHCKHIGRLEENEQYNIYVMGMYNWAIIPPDLSQIDDVEHHNEQLQTILTEHRKEHARVREVFDMRQELLLCKKDREPGAGSSSGEGVSEKVESSVWKDTIN